MILLVQFSIGIKCAQMCDFSPHLNIMQTSKPKFNEQLQSSSLQHRYNIHNENNTDIHICDEITPGGHMISS